MARRAALAVVAVVAASRAGGADGASCVRYSSVMSDGSATFCAGLVGDFFFSEQDPATEEEALAVQEATEREALVRMTGQDPSQALVVSLLDTGCTAAIKRAVCMAVFPECFTGLLAGSERSAVPKMPCKNEVCFEPIAQTSLDAACPLVSGLFVAELSARIGDSATDPKARSDFQDILNNSPCSSQPESCVVTVNFLSLFGLAPNCAEQQGSIEVFPDGTQPIFAALSSCQTAEGDAVSCDEVRTCAAQSQQPPVVQPQIEVVAGSSVCNKVTGRVDNSDPLLSHNLALADAAQQPTEDDFSQCLRFNKLDLYKKAFFVPASFPGQAPFGQVQGTEETERLVNNWNFTACPTRPESFPFYANFEEEPLCVSPVDGTKRYNTRDCLELKLKDTLSQFPEFAPFGCRAAFFDLVCSTGQMKLESKNICLLPDGAPCELSNPALALSTNTMALQFALPKFPARQLCTNFKDQCGDFLARLGERGAALDINCGTTVVNVTTCDNGNLGSAWGCTNSFNGIPQYPELSQTFAQVGSVPQLAAHVARVGLEEEPINAELRSTVAGPSLSKVLFDAEASLEELKDVQDSVCFCPFPLVVPDDPFAETIEGTCCALPCRGTMSTQDEMVFLGTLTLVLNGIGIPLMAFLVVTWSIFKEKRHQYMTFWIFFSALQISSAFLLLPFASGTTNVEPVLCIDNSQPNTMETGPNLCSFLGAYVFFWGLAICGWWLAQAIDLYRKLVLRNRNTTKDKRKYMALAWVPASVSTIAMLATNSFGYSKNTPYCFVVGGSAVELLGFYSIVTYCVIVGSFCMFSVLAVLVRYTFGLRTTTNSNRLVSQLKLYRSPIFFVMVFLFVFLSLLRFQIYVAINEDLFEDQGKAWVQCLLENFQRGIQDPAFSAEANNSGLIDPVPGLVGCGETQGGVSRGSIRFVYILIMSFSILSFLTFGVSEMNCDLWLRHFQFEDYEPQGDTDTNTKRNLENSLIEMTTVQNAAELPKSYKFQRQDLEHMNVSFGPVSDDDSRVDASVSPTSPRQKKTPRQPMHAAPRRGRNPMSYAGDPPPNLGGRSPR